MNETITSYSHEKQIFSHPVPEEGNVHLLLLVLVHFSQRQEVFDQKHEVDSAQSRQALPHGVQVLLVLLVEVMPLRGVRHRVLVVVMVASLRLKHM